MKAILLMVILIIRGFGSYQEMLQFKPGKYKVVHDGTLGTRTLSPDENEIVNTYPTNTILEIIKIRNLISENRIRGQVSGSLDWVSIKNTADGFMWVKPILETEHDTSENTVGENLLSELSKNNFPRILKYLNNEEIKKLKAASKYFADNMEEWWKIRMEDGSIFETYHPYSKVQHPCGDGMRSANLTICKNMLKKLPNDVLTFKLDGGVERLKPWLGDKYDGSALKVGDWVEMNKFILPKMIKTFEEKEQLFSIKSASSVLLQMLALKYDPNNYAFVFEIKEIIRDNENEIENLKIQVILDDAALESKQSQAEEIMVLKEGLNFVQKMEGKKGNFEVGDRIKPTNIEKIESLLRAYLKNDIIPYDPSQDSQYLFYLLDDLRMLIKDIDDENNRALLSFYELGEDDLAPINFTPKNGDFWISLNKLTLFKKLTNDRTSILFSTREETKTGEDLPEEVLYFSETKLKFRSSTARGNYDYKQFIIAKDDLYFEFQKFDDDCLFEIHDAKNNKTFYYVQPETFEFEVKMYSYPFKFFEL